MIFKNYIKKTSVETFVVFFIRSCHTYMSSWNCYGNPDTSQKNTIFIEDD